MIVGKRIRKVDSHISHISEGSKVYLGLVMTDEVKEILKRLGYDQLQIGETLLPPPELGSVSKYNSQGKMVINRQLPKIDLCRDQYYDIKDWHGNRHTGTRIVCRKVFQKDQIPPPEIYLTIVGNSEEKFIIAEEVITKNENLSKQNVIHIINLFLEIFGKVDFLDTKLHEYKKIDIKRINWEILRNDIGSWDDLRDNVDELLKHKKISEKILVKNRLELISEYSPNLVVTGINGYRGYIVFGFPSSNIFIFESLEYGNATYIFEGGWEELSKMTKREIMNGRYYKNRFIHQKGWSDQLREVLKATKG
ncbi:hypothetical protein JCM19047_1379 [Bacillus sp. JCM 19047]|nr:hypothetical protein JCM19047_1379 [Bacillus sp. JCM 19047]